jgi:hypothetical protein
MPFSRLLVLALAGWLTCTALGAAPARADDGTEARLRALEQALRSQEEEVRLLRAELAARRALPPPAPAPSPTWTTPTPPAAPPAAAVAGAVPSGANGAGAVAARAWHPAAGGVRVGGYATLEFLAPSDANSHFDLHRLVLMLDASITRCLDFRGEIEWEHGGVSDELEGEVVVEQAELLFRLSDAFRPKLGALLVPFGRYNLYHDDPINDFTRRPLTAVSLLPTGWGIPGVGVEGAVPLGCHVVTYDAVLNNGFKDDFRADEGVRDARQIWNEDENEGKQAWARVAMAWRVAGLDRLETGVSATTATYDVEDRNRLTGVALDGLLRWGALELKGEYLAYDYERDDLDPIDAIRGQSGLWAEAGYHFQPSFLCGCRSCLVQEVSHFTLALRWMTQDLDDQVRGATFEDDLEVWSLGLNYRLTERTVLRVDWSWFDAVLAPDREELTFSFSTYF